MENSVLFVGIFLTGLFGIKCVLEKDHENAGDWVFATITSFVITAVYAGIAL